MELMKYIYFLTRVNRLGNAKIRNIVTRIGNGYDFLNCSRKDLRRIEGIDTGISEEIFLARQKIEEINKDFDEILLLAERKKINLTNIYCDDYPENLNHIYDSPVILYYKGKLTRKDKFSISVVGTRNPTEYGKYNCEVFSEKLSHLGLPVVSGFARGIDSIAHKTAVKNGNVTYAVLGSGVDVVYPYENGKLYNEIIENGAIVSEFPIGSKPEKVNFPKRNRVISGVGIGTLVIESGIKGGSILTAEFAIDQNKEVFAVPGYINSKQSAGTNDLIKRGQAKLVTSIDDIINELEQKLKPVLNRSACEKEDKIIKDLNYSEKRIYEVLDYKLKHIDEINEDTNLPVSDCLVSLLSLEFKGLIRQVPGKNFIKI